MAAPTPTSRDSDLVTVEEFYGLVPDGQKADLIDGVIYLASPDTRRSARVAGRFHYGPKLSSSRIVIKSAFTPL